MKTTCLMLPLLLLTACGSVETSVTDPETGTKTSIAASLPGSSGISAPADLPDFAALMPGASVQSAIRGSEGETRGLVSYQVKASPAAVIEHYRKLGTAAGLKTLAEATTGDGRMLAMGRENGNDAAMQVTVTPYEGEDMVMVALVYDAGAGK
jgi:hypothetical protein